MLVAPTKSVPTDSVGLSVVLGLLNVQVLASTCRTVQAIVEPAVTLVVRVSPASKGSVLLSVTQVKPTVPVPVETHKLMLLTVVVVVKLAEMTRLVSVAFAPARLDKRSAVEFVSIFRPAHRIVVLVEPPVLQELLVPVVHAPVPADNPHVPTFVSTQPPTTATVVLVEQLAVKGWVSVFLVHVVRSHRPVKTTPFVVRQVHSA